MAKKLYSARIAEDRGGVITLELTFSFQCEHCGQDERVKRDHRLILCRDRSDKEVAKSLEHFAQEIWPHI